MGQHDVPARHDAVRLGQGAPAGRPGHRQRGRERERVVDAPGDPGYRSVRRRSSRSSPPTTFGGSWATCQARTTAGRWEPRCAGRKAPASRSPPTGTQIRSRFHATAGPSGFGEE